MGFSDYLSKIKTSPNSGCNEMLQNIMIKELCTVIFHTCMIIDNFILGFIKSNNSHFRYHKPSLIKIEYSSRVVLRKC